MTLSTECAAALPSIGYQSFNEKNASQEEFSNSPLLSECTVKNQSSLHSEKRERMDFQGLRQ